MKKDWEIKKIGEVCEILDNKRKPITKRYRTEGKYPYYGATGILDYVSDYIFDEKLILLGEDGAKWNSGENSAFIAEGKYWVNNHAHVLRPNRSIVSDDWIVYFLNFKDLREHVTGLTVPKLNQAKMREIVIPIPPIFEQQQIISILNRTFQSINKVKQNAEANLKNIREFYDSYLQNIFENKGKDWIEKKLGVVCEYDKTPFKKTELPYVGLEDIQSNTGKLIGPLTPRTVKSTTFYFTGEHVLYGRLRPYLNKVLLPDFEGHCSTEIFPIKPVKEILNRKYLFRWLISTEVMNKINATWSGATLPRANMNAVLEFKINIPPLKEQESIVKKLDTLSAETKKLESIYQKKLESLEELKKSILEKAFNGELETKKFSMAI